MKLKILLGVSSALCLCATVAQAQETNQVEQLQQQLRQMQENFEKIEAEQHRQIEALQKQVELLAQKQVVVTNVVAAAEPTNAVSPGLFQELSDKVDNVVAAQKKSLPSEFNPALGFVGETVTGYRSMGSDQTGSSRTGGFDVWARSLELNASASVDPFAKAWIVANASADAATGESTFGIEEAALQTTSLPGNFSASSADSRTFTTTNCFS